MKTFLSSNSTKNNCWRPCQCLWRSICSRPWQRQWFTWHSQETPILLLSQDREIAQLLHFGIYTCCIQQGSQTSQTWHSHLDGNLLNWKWFWKQFCVSINDNFNLSNVKKLVYLQPAFEDGCAKNAIKGLFRSGEHYGEAIDCLKSRYDCPYLILQTHVWVIIDAPSLKDGGGRELCHVHDTV